MAGSKEYVSYAVMLKIVIALVIAGSAGTWTLAQDKVTFREYERWVTVADKRADRLESKIDEILVHLRGRK